jgi:uncharacterized protein
MVDLYADTGDKRWLTCRTSSSITPSSSRSNATSTTSTASTATRRSPSSSARPTASATGARRATSWRRVLLGSRRAAPHSFATGGHGKDEYFHEPDKLSDIKEGRTAETCNVYNMLKLTRRLFEFEPDAHYADFHERALFNHILASIDPNDGRTCYMVPVGQAVQHEYADMFRSFTCCVGTGMESHALHGDGIYYEAGAKKVSRSRC